MFNYLMENDDPTDGISYVHVHCLANAHVHVVSVSKIFHYSRLRLFCILLMREH